METKRLFIAICLCQEIKNNLYKHLEPLRQKITEVKWVQPEQAHFTLAFLGNVAQEKEVVINQVCHETAERYRTFAIHLNNPGTFPNENRPQVV